GDQRAARLRSAILPVLLPDEIVDGGLCSLPRIERANAPIDFYAQCAQLFDMREQRPPDLFLILLGQALHFGNGLFKRFDHDANIPNPQCKTASVASVARMERGAIRVSHTQ